MSEENIVFRFLAGSVDAVLFSEALYSDGELGGLLRDPSLSWSDSYVGRYGDVFDYLITLNYSQLGDIINAMGALELFLGKKGIGGVVVNRTYNDLFRLMLDAMPGYVDMDIDVHSAFYRQQLLPIVEREITRAEKKKQIREKVKALFQYQTKPPRWIQGAAWPMRDDVPLFFVGQVALKHEAFHDDGAVYIFLDTTSGEIKTVQQFY